MSILHSKHVLVIGDDSPQIHDIEQALKQAGATLHTATCSGVTPEQIEAGHIDLIFLNHLHDDSHCVHLMKEIRNKRDTRTLPVFVLVDGEEKGIEHVLGLGAADYYTPHETVQSVMDKVRIVLGDSVNVASDSGITISDTAYHEQGHTVRVLVIEDDPLLSNLLAMRLEKAQFPYLVDAIGDNLLETIDKFKPDIVILDIMLPGHSGFELLSEIRSSSTHSKLPVLIFSNRDSAEDKQKAKELFADGFFVKAMTDLDDLILNIISHSTVTNKQ